MSVFALSDAPEGTPDELGLGTLIQWRLDNLADDYANDTYTPKYRARLAGSGGTELSIDASADGTGFAVSVPSATSATYTPGTYYWTLYIERNSDNERIVIETGIWKLLPNRDVDASDPRSHARIMLDKIESVLEKRADADIDNYAIGGRSLTKMSVQDLLQWRSHYRAEVEAEDDEIARRRGKAKKNSVQVRFV